MPLHFGSIQGQYTETGTLHSWAVYRNGIIHDVTEDSPDVIYFHVSGFGSHDVTENSPGVICFHVSGFSAKAVDTLE